MNADRTVYNIVSGTVTNRRDVVPFRVTAGKWFKRTLIISASLFAAFLTLGFVLMGVGYGS